MRSVHPSLSAPEPPPNDALQLAIAFPVALSSSLSLNHPPHYVSPRSLYVLEYIDQRLRAMLRRHYFEFPAVLEAAATARRKDVLIVTLLHG